MCKEHDNFINHYWYQLNVTALVLLLFLTTVALLFSNELFFLRLSHLFNIFCLVAWIFSSTEFERIQSNLEFFKERLWLLLLLDVIISSTMFDGGLRTESWLCETIIPLWFLLLVDCWCWSIWLLLNNESPNVSEFSSMSSSESSFGFELDS